MPLSPGKQHAFSVDGVPLKATVSPCSHMYENYGLQVRVEMEDGGCTYQHDPKPFAACADADFLALCAKVRISPCATLGCPGHAFVDPASNRNGRCEKCFLADIDREFSALRKKAQAAALRRNARRKAQGYTHRVEAWVHPAEGGDDFPVEMYFRGEPDARAIQDILSGKYGSAVTCDWNKEEL